MRGRIVSVDAAPEHADRETADLECSAVRFSVNAAREAAHDDEACPAELATKPPRDLGAVRRARARTDDSDRGTPEERQVGVAANEETRRRGRTLGRLELELRD